MRVLIVEDELTVAGAMASALEARGHEVVVARSVQLALGMPRPEVLVADADLSGLSGLDLLEQYRRSGSVPRTVFVSAAPRPEDCQRALRLGAAEFLTKPFRLDELVRAVEDSRAGLEPAFEEIYPATQEALEAALRDLAAFALRCGVGPSCRARACTATGEVILNVLVHAFAPGVGLFRLRACVEGRDLVIEVHDAGRGFDGSLIAIEAMADGGGLSRVAALVEDLDLQSHVGHGTTCTLRLGAYRVDFEDSDHVDLSEHDFLTPDTAREVLETLAQAGDEGLFQLSPAMAVVIGRLLAGPDTSRLAAQALRS